MTWTFDAAPVTEVGIYRQKFGTSACKSSVGQAVSGDDLNLTLTMKKSTKKNACEVMAAWIDPT